jgi:glyoxylase-like metal-dependent hydrolase (beta-lactamase superfamily II)
MRDTKDARARESASKIDRREFLVTAGAGLAGVALAPPLAWAAAPPRRLTVGAFEVMVVSDGHLVLPTSFLATGAPAKEFGAALAAAGQGGEQYHAPTNCTLIRTGGELILVDSGSGPHFMPSAGKLADNLAAAGIDRAQITMVVYTHGHPDHLWGVVDEFDEPNFPNASYVVATREWDFWHGVDALTGLPAERAGFVTGARRSYGHVEDKMRTVKAGDEIVSGLRIIDTPGHTQGHVSLELAGGDGLIVLGDALTHPVISFQYPDWRPVSDHVPEQAAATRRRLLDRLAGEKTRIIGFHLPYPGIGRVERKDGAYRYVAET